VTNATANGIACDGPPTKGRDEMFTATDTGFAPWYVLDANDKKKARLNLITHLLSKVSYKKAPREKVKLPRRQKAKGYREPAYPYKYVPARY